MESFSESLTIRRPHEKVSHAGDGGAWNPPDERKMEPTYGDVKIRKELPCNLMQDEIMVYSKEMAKNCQDKAKTEASKKEAMADFNARIARYDAEIAVVSQKISNGYEYRDVECLWTYYWDDDYKVLIRQDTFAEVDRKTIDPHERQTELFEEGATP